MVGTDIGYYGTMAVVVEDLLLCRLSSSHQLDLPGGSEEKNLLYYPNVC